MLQVESSSEIGWFLYSMKAMDAGVLVDEKSDIIGLQVQWQTTQITKNPSIKCRI
jgi:hypothetical protein